MRKSAILIISLLSSSAFALDYPEPSNPVAKALVEQYKQDKALIDSPNLFEVPDPVPAWACNVPDGEKYKISGLQEADPELKGKIEKANRKLYRENGVAGLVNAKVVFSNIQIVPLKTQCVNGKLDGEVELLVSYDRKIEGSSTIPMGAEVVHISTVTNTHTITRSSRIFEAGKMGPGRSFVQTTTQVDTRYDNAQMEALMKKNNEQSGHPKTARSVVYSGQGGLIVTISEADEQKVSAGLFGVNYKAVPMLSTSIIEPIDEHHKRLETYKNKQLIMTARMKDNKFHGEQVTYNENWLKKLNLRIDQQPNMENAREVTINGVDLIETHTCWQNQVLVKMSPCPSE